VFAAGTMRFLAVMGHLTIRSFFANAAGDIRDTTFGYDNGGVRKKLGETQIKSPVEPLCPLWFKLSSDT
jgi:hypothetical protein